MCKPEYLEILKKMWQLSLIEQIYITRRHVFEEQSNADAWHVARDQT